MSHYRGVFGPFTYEEWELLKKYAAAKRKYEVGKGYTVKVAVQELVGAAFDALLHSEICDSDGNPVDWKEMLLNRYF